MGTSGVIIDVLIVFTVMGRMSMCCFMLTDATLNKDRLIKICMMHDVAESVVGDITPADNVPADVKKQLELVSLDDYFLTIP